MLSSASTAVSTPQSSSLSNAGARAGPWDSSHRSRWRSLGLADHVTVYLPFSYSLSGRLLIYPASEVYRLHTETLTSSHSSSPVA